MQQLTTNTARTTVHITDVQDKFSPYETLLELATADELNDTALAATFPLHTASPALSSSVNQLNEISEDNEDGDSGPKPSHAPSVLSVTGPRVAPALEQRPASQRSYRSPSFSSAKFGAEFSPVLKQKSSLSQFLVREELGHKSVTRLSEYSPSEDTLSIKDRTSISTARTAPVAPSGASPRLPATGSADYDLDKYLDTLFKPKIKLGPRPVTMSEKGKRTTAAVSTSSLPAGVQSRARQHLSLAQPQPTSSIGPPRLPSLRFSPQIPDIPDFLPPRPSSRGSSRSLPAARASKSLMTPEKQRLMKALEIRNKQMRNSSRVEPTPVITSAQLQKHQAQRETSADKADSGIDIADASVSEAHPTSLLQLQAVAASQPGASRATFISATPKQQDTLCTNSVRQPAMSDTQGQDVFVDCPALGITASVPNIVEPAASQKQSPPSDEAVASYTTHNQTTMTAVHGPPTKMDFPPLSPTSTVFAGVQHHLVADKDVPQDIIKTDSDTQDQHHLVADVNSPQDNMKTTDSQLQDAVALQDQNGSLASEDLDMKDCDSVGPETEEASEQVPKTRRKGLVEPLQIEVRIQRHTSEYRFLADDKFMDELQTATFEQATPVALSKSPASPFFPPRRPSSKRSAKSSASVTTAVSAVSAQAAAPAATSMSAVSNATDERQIHPDLFLRSSEEQVMIPSRTTSVSSVRTDFDRSDTVSLLRRSTNVSSGIAGRIAALAESSTRDVSPPVAPGSRNLSANSSLAQRKSSLIEQLGEGQAISGAERRPIGKLSAWPDATPAHLRTNDAQAKRSSISVTARIVRVPRASEAAPSSELHASTLLFNHRRSSHPDSAAPLTSTVSSPRPFKDSRGEHASVMTPHSRDGLASRGSVEANATGRRRSSVKGPSAPSSPKSGSKHGATSPLDGSLDKASRTSRFFKRISTLAKDRKKSVPSITTTPSELSPTIPSFAPLHPTPIVVNAPLEPTSVVTPARAPASTPAPAPALLAASNTLAAPSFNSRPDSVADVPPHVSIGDFNVQFPDTLVSCNVHVHICTVKLTAC
jgi:hypothetical protein